MKDNQMESVSEVYRKTQETEIRIRLNLHGKGKHEISSGIPFFNHMLSLFTVHGFFDLSLEATGDLQVDLHHTVEDVGLVLGEVFNKALGDRKRIKRYGYAVTPMDDALSAVTIDLSNRPFLVYHVPGAHLTTDTSFTTLSKEFFRAFATKGGMNLHINVLYGENEHHILESIFKSCGRALDQATSFDERLSDVRSTKGTL
ncbi:MAG: imidazoleglycerol-phosphate dehydratase HisB [Desulfobacterales bacterium]|nr:imidazoleglycerol-phosphate dehydratase HisB [Desulfobacterales bacterium]